MTNDKYQMTKTEGRQAMRLRLFGIIFVLAALPLLAAGGDGEDEIILKSGGVIRGTIIETKGNKLVIAIRQGKTSIPVDLVKEIRKVTEIAQPSPPPEERPAPPPVSVAPEPVQPIPKSNGKPQEPPKSAPEDRPKTTDVSSTLPQLLDAYRSEDIELDELVFRLTQAGEKYLNDMIALLSRNDPSLPKDAVLQALGNLQARGAIPAIAGVLASPVPKHRLAAVQTLGILGGREVISPILQAVGDEDDQISFTAIDTLLKRAESDEDATSWLAIEAETLLATGDERTLTRLALLLGKFKSAESFGLLQKLLSDGNEAVQCAAVQSFGLVREPATVDILMPMLGEASPTLQTEICKVLALFNDTRPVPALIDLLKNDDATLTESAHKALVSITGCLFEPDFATWSAWLEKIRAKKF
ncbi:MAG: hypothetical protein A2Z34_07285 [Planctomycetes bacterium RBG_16_59_8]|nr:MAG: hypothetical protein A2Z34_07285 [Planctomycetes bacterium RBG_16_59_8]